eukprot:gene21270-biopygen7115
MRGVSASTDCGTTTRVAILCCCSHRTMRWFQRCSVGCPLWLELRLAAAALGKDPAPEAAPEPQPVGPSSRELARLIGAHAALPCPVLPCPALHLGRAVRWVVQCAVVVAVAVADAFGGMEIQIQGISVKTRGNTEKNMVNVARVDCRALEHQKSRQFDSSTARQYDSSSTARQYDSLDSTTVTRQLDSTTVTRQLDSTTVLDSSTVRQYSTARQYRQYSTARTDSTRQLDSRLAPSTTVARPISAISSSPLPRPASCSDRGAAGAWRWWRWRPRQRRRGRWFCARRVLPRPPHAHLAGHGDKVLLNEMLDRQEEVYNLDDALFNGGVNAVFDDVD